MCHCRGNKEDRALEIVHIKHILNAGQVKPVNLPTVDSSVRKLHLFHSLKHQNYIIQSVIPPNNGVLMSG